MGILDKWLTRKLDERMAELAPSDHRSLRNVLTDTNPVMMVYRISNGYIVASNLGEPGPLHKRPSYTYCPDAKGVADMIVANQAKQKLGVPEQLDMFSNVEVTPHLSITPVSFK